MRATQKEEGMRKLRALIVVLVFAFMSLGVSSQAHAWTCQIEGDPSGTVCSVFLKTVSVLCGGKLKIPCPL